MRYVFPNEILSVLQDCASAAVSMEVAICELRPSFDWPDEDSHVETVRAAARAALSDVLKAEIRALFWSK